MGNYSPCADIKSADHAIRRRFEALEIGRLTGLFKILRADNGAHADIQLQKIIKACHYCSLLFTVCFSGSSLTMAAPRISTAPVRPNRPSFSPRISADRSTATTGSM